MGYLENKRDALLMNTLQNGGRLPAEFQEVEYIERQGNPRTNLCYIKTGIFSINNIEIEAIIEPTNDNYYHAITGANFGASIKLYNGSYYTPNNIFAKTISGKTTIKCGVNNSSQRYIKIDGITYNSTNASRQLELYIFDVNDGTTPFNGDGTSLNTIAEYNGKLFEAKITQSGTLERHFIPCYRKVDNVIGLYDLVYSQFYTNQGTGTFTKGPDV